MNTSLFNDLATAINGFYEVYPDATNLEAECWDIAVMLQSSPSFAELEPVQRANLIYLLKIMPSFSKAVFEMVGRDLSQYT